MAPLRSDDPLFGRSLADAALLERIERALEVLDRKVDELKDSLPDRFVPRQEYMTRHDDLMRRVGILENVVSKLTWGVLGALATALGGLLMARLHLGP